MPNPLSVLAVDDDEVFLRNLSFSLAPEFEFHTAHSGVEALDVLAKRPIDVILLDHVLNGSMNGVETYDAIRKRGHSQPVVVVSGQTSLEMAKDFLKRQVSGFVEKPVLLAEVRDSIHHAQQSIAQDRQASALPHWLNDLEFKVDTIKRIVSWQGEDCGLTRIEFDLLVFFLQSRKTQITREQIHSHIWPDTSVTKHTLDTHLLNLRRKLPPFSDHLVVIYGVGFCYDR